MKNLKIIFLSLGLLLIVTTLVVSISAWLTDTVQTPDTTFIVGDVEYKINGDFIDDGIVVPGQELLKSDISLTNSSTVKSKLRVRVIVTVKKGTDAPVAVSDLNTLFTTTGSTGGNFSFLEGWNKVTTENTWYYGPATGTDPGDEILTTTTSINVISTLKLDGSKVGNSYSTDIITVKFIFEAKQADYVTWGELASAQIDFSTGLAR